jgi:hypothetical protein
VQRIVRDREGDAALSEVLAENRDDSVNVEIVLMFIEHPRFVVVPEGPSLPKK